MIELGLQRISRLLARTPLPWRAIHVAGTNGKGSICAYVSGMLDVYNNSALREAMLRRRLRHGRFTSPHVIDRWDCITIDQCIVPSSLFHEIEKVVLDRNERESIGASEFELLTATAFEIFTQEEVDVAVVEVGMGGRLDATNIIGNADGLEDASNVESFRPAPLVTAFSNIGLDHQEFLGDTVEAIAAEKAGIMKSGVPVVCDGRDANVSRVIFQAAANDGCPTDLAKYIPAIALKPGGQNRADEDHLQPARPAHVAANFAVAEETFYVALARLGCLPEADSRFLSALQELEHDVTEVRDSIQFPGRQQQISIESITGRKNYVLLDGAHNHQSALALADTITALRSQRDSRVTWVLAASSSKDVKEIVSPLIKDGDAVYAVEFGPVDGMPWVKPTANNKLLEAVKAVLPSQESLHIQAFGNDLASALRAASQKAAEGPLVIAGSLYLVGDTLRLLRDSKTLDQTSTQLSTP